MRRLLSTLIFAVVACVSCTAVPERTADKEIVDITWTTPDFRREIRKTVNCQSIGLIVATRGYRSGETVRVTVINHEDPAYEVPLYGVVGVNGEARILWEEGACEGFTPSSRKTASLPS
jgi:hypothetical protein